MTDHTKLVDELRTKLAAMEQDVKRLDWLDAQGYSYGFEDMHEGVVWRVDGPFANIRQAIDNELEQQSND